LALLVVGWVGGSRLEGKKKLLRLCDTAKKKKTRAGKPDTTTLFFFPPSPRPSFFRFVLWVLSRVGTPTEFAGLLLFFFFGWRMNLALLECRGHLPLFVS
jgi:hypothetical protein